MLNFHNSKMGYLLIQLVKLIYSSYLFTKNKKYHYMRTFRKLFQYFKYLELKKDLTADNIFINHFILFQSYLRLIIHLR